MGGFVVQSENSNLKIFEKQQIKFSEHINETGYKPDINRSKVARLFEISSIYYNTLVKYTLFFIRTSKILLRLGCSYFFGTFSLKLFLSCSNF